MRKPLIVVAVLALCSTLVSCATPPSSGSASPVYVRPNQGPVIPNPFNVTVPKGY